VISLCADHSALKLRKDEGSGCCWHKADMPIASPLSGVADGSTVPSATFVIRSLKVGNRLLENVTGSIASAQADLLLGQSFLSRFNSWSIDNKRQVLLLN
jgi:hypothetical protein